MTHRIINDLDRAIDRDAEALDRAHITHWLMMFAARKPLDLQHPQMGRIHYSGIGFEGSPAIVYDRYVILVIEDLVEAHTKATEAALEAVPEDRVMAVAEEAAGRIQAVRARLRHRAAEVKAIMLGKGRGSVPVPINVSAVVSIPVKARLVERAAELLAAKRPAPTQTPILAPVERLYARNPGLFNSIGLIVAVIGVVAAILALK